MTDQSTPERQPLGDWTPFPFADDILEVKTEAERLKGGA
jgi:hypothetical protein